MLHLSLLWLVLALVAAIFGFGGVESSGADAGRILFFVFTALAVLTFVGNYARPPRDLV